MELHRPPAAAGILDRHHDAVRSHGSDLESAGYLLGPGVQGMVPGRNELLRQSGQQRAAQHLHVSGLAVHGRVQQAQRTTGMLDHRLKPEADAECGQSPLVECAEQLVAVEVGRAARPRRQHHQVRGELFQELSIEARAQRSHLGTLLAEVPGQRVHERVLMVDQEDGHAVSGECI